MAKPLTQSDSTIISRTELVSLRLAEEIYRKAVAALTAAENVVKPLRLELASKVLGIQHQDELKKLSPLDLERLMEKRAKQGAFETVRGAPQFRFVKTSQGRYPAWKTEFISRLGEILAEQITAETPTLYSYVIEVD